MPYLIAITGASGSGKSTLAQALMDKIGPDQVTLVREDNYYRPRSDYGTEAINWTPAEVEKHIDFDDPASKDMDLFQAHVKALASGQSNNQPVYDFATHDRVAKAANKLPARPVVILEGLHCLFEPSMFDLCDLTVYVDTPSDICLARRIWRDSHERGRSVERILDQYLTFVRPAHARYTAPAKLRCDLIISDDGPLASSVGAPSPEARMRLLAPVWAAVSKHVPVG